MVQNPDVILGPNGLPVWQCNPSTGSTAQSGTLTAADVVVPIEASPAVPGPGYLKIYSPDGQSVRLINPAGGGQLVAAGAAYATVAGAGQTVTGVTAEAVLAAGITVPAGGLATGQVYHLVAYGTLTTTATTQTVELRVRYGGLAGTQVHDFGAQNPSSGATISGASWRAEYEIIMTSPTTMTVSGQDALNFFPTSVGNSSTAVSNSSAQQLVLTVTPSATGVSMTCTGFSCERVA